MILLEVANYFSLLHPVETIMVTIDERLVAVQTRAADKQEAIRLAGQLLVDSGYIEPGYIDSMLEREKVANTYLGNGISIPHGLPKDRDLIKQTGISVVQVPEGVAWNPGETARLIVGIAAKSDEHIDVLRRLTRVLGDQEQVARLVQTRDPRDIIEALTGERPTQAPTAPPVADYPDFFDAVILNKTGLHARPAATFVDLAKRFEADIKVHNGNLVANGKSLISLLQLGVEHGTTVRVSAQGPDASEALNTLKNAIAVGLGDEPEEQLPPAPGKSTSGWVARHAVTTISGVPAAGGLAVGPVRQYAQKAVSVVEDRPEGDPASEGYKLQNALNAAQNELDHLHEEVKTRLGSGKAAIFRVHGEFLNDDTLIMQTVTLIYQGHSAAWSWQQVINERVKQMQKLDDPTLAGRAIDLSDVGLRVLHHLVEDVKVEPLNLTTPAILIADDLTPSDTASLDVDMILGICTARGGPTSHTAILARGFGLPAVVGAGAEVLEVADGTSVILDGDSGKLYIKPSDADIQSARERQQRLQQEQEKARAASAAPAITTDGHRVEISANINRAADAAQALAAGAEGVGLMRTEFLFLGRDSVPTEDEQFEAYRDMAQALGDRPLIIRTLDIGGDKEIPYLNLPHEDNAFLGVRGIRLCLIRPDLFIPQLRAIYRAAAYGRVHIMFPMISTLEDIERARAITEQVRQELNAPPIPLGIMIEVPSAVMLAHYMAREVDFFSIGTNDLTQYTLAMDRLHPQLARQADALHPAVLRMIAQVVQAASKEGKWVGVCGGLAGDLKGAAILTGLGVTELSMSVPSIATVKAHLRSRSFAELQQIAQKALQCRTAAEVRSL
jgi:phosphoenolpyruvate-protein phosphotransferase